MTPERSHLPLPSRPWSLAAPAVLIALASFGCAPDDQMEPDPAADDPGMAADETMAQPETAIDAPPCQFTAEGEELTGRASPPDSATVQLGDATAKICYGAPSMNDRAIMGELVPYDEPWRIGANEPTTLHLPVAAEIGDVEVAPGSYSLFAIPGEDEWEIVVNSNVDRWGIPIDEDVRETDVGSFTVEPEASDGPVERMIITMESDMGDGATVAMEWENTRVSFPIEPAQE